MQHFSHFSDSHCRRPVGQRWQRAPGVCQPWSRRTRWWPWSAPGGAIQWSPPGPAGLPGIWPEIAERRGPSLASDFVKTAHNGRKVKLSCYLCWYLLFLVLFLEVFLLVFFSIYSNHTINILLINIVIYVASLNLSFSAESDFWLLTIIVLIHFAPFIFRWI